MTTLLFLPPGLPDPDAPVGLRWMRFGDTGMLARGEGTPPEGDRVVAVAPADAVTLHWADLPGRSVAQATAAARILAAEASAATTGELHVAVGEGGAGSPDRPIAVVGAAAMREWLAMLAAAGVDPIALVPAPMLLPQPDEGYYRATVGGVGVIRGRTSGFADEAQLTELVTAGAPVKPLVRDPLERALAAAAAAPVLDLRQGAFARRRKLAIDWRLIRRLAMYGGAILLVSFAISLVRLAKYDVAADTVNARADALAATGLPRGETLTDPDRQLDERGRRVIGPGLGFTTTTAAAFAAIRSVPGTEVTAIDFTDTGELRLTVATEREALATDLKNALEAAGFRVRASVFQSNGGRVTGELTVSRR
ncbi:type II secretion system protein GspL [Sphingomonas sp. KR1UV-12]|uniref:Type II secretion system protein GspL n=1 Tax=Sphingomonas aurea TaxID=3063994 RepID=A0ABT9EG86_9SPHN|nr:type II secretion system protein GspL [Sphingomonas sp. KR1UV-12]MDP1025980.1 type II secretion system protein GspL [Sphingomonas sp. KR1UV-12]